MKISTGRDKASAVMLITFCLVGSLTVGCSADWLYLYSVEELTRRADVILVGRVESIINCPDLDNVPYWSRLVQVSVERYLKHFMESTNVSVIVDGATFGNNIYGASGNAPEFEEYERVLLFLKEGVDGYYEVLGDAQGKFTIVNDTAVSEVGRVIENVRGFTETDSNYRRMVEEADFVVVGNVTNVYKTNHVYVTIDIEEFVTNPLNITQISLSARNGEAGTLHDDGSISSTSNGELFNVGERVFVYVERTGHSFWVLHGVVGKYRVWGNSNISLARRKIIDGWYAVPDFRYRTVVYYNVTAVNSGPGGERTNPESISHEAAELPVPKSALIWPNIFIAVITVLIVSLLVLVIWRKMKP